jgi:C-terminal processing protease CtpA/Prc
VRRTRTGFAYRYHPTWSPDSTHIVFWDKTGTIYLHTLASGETRYVDQDPWGTDAGWIGLSWSPDSNWIAYARNGAGMSGSIWLYDVAKQANHQVTGDLFNDEFPVFDRAGDYLYFRTNRHFSPKYGELDSSFIYSGTQVLVAVPLRNDQTSPWAPKSDEEGDTAGGNGDAGAKGKKKRGRKKRAAAAGNGGDDGVSGTWEGVVDFGAAGGDLPQGAVEFAITLALASDHTLTGTVAVSVAGGEGGEASITEGSYDPATGRFSFTASSDQGGSWQVDGTITKGDPPTMKGSATESNLGMTIPFSGKRTAAGGGGDDGGGDETVATPGTAKVKPVRIDLEGFEARAMKLPVKAGNFGTLGVNAKGQLIYVRKSARGHGGKTEIKLFDITDKKKAEQTVGAGSRFILTADGKKMLIPRGGSAVIQNAGAGASGKPVVTAGMDAWIDPRVEWMQLFTEAWRLQRDFFYDPGLHGVDWPAVRRRYAPLIGECVTRNDVAYVIREMISELNVGHAYYGGGDVPNGPASVSVGLLGCDFELAGGAYRIAAIHRGGDHDLDARGPLSQPGVKVAEGDYLLAVNGVPVDTAKDPWAAFLGLAGKTITLTVSAKPVRDADARDVVVRALGSEVRLRYRAWIEKNRRYVHAKTGGKVGYIYVPDTGVNGQNDLVRQYSGQINTPALIIDERWNGGGQIPTRFVELLNRPIVNYWARRDGKSWPWPYDGHQGPKCMLINGHAGSGGDAFPAYFRKAGLGKLIGTRTWGGLVGISGNPGLIDGGRVTVPTFGYYKPDGTWGIEGHGVDPDIEVIDDPSKMRDGADPQLDAAIAHILEELKTKQYTPTPKPPSPNRGGMGIPEKDR